jgi:hypothetical protein
MCAMETEGDCKNRAELRDVENLEPNKMGLKVNRGEIAIYVYLPGALTSVGLGRRTYRRASEPALSGGRLLRKAFSCEMMWETGGCSADTTRMSILRCRPNEVLRKVVSMSGIRSFASLSD